MEHLQMRALFCWLLTQEKSRSCHSALFNLDNVVGVKSTGGVDVQLPPAELLALPEAGRVLRPAADTSYNQQPYIHSVSLIQPTSGSDTFILFLIYKCYIVNSAVGSVQHSLVN